MLVDTITCKFRIAVTLSIDNWHRFFEHIQLPSIPRSGFRVGEGGITYINADIVVEMSRATTITTIIIDHRATTLDPWRTGRG